MKFPVYNQVSNNIEMNMDILKASITTELKIGREELYLS